MNQLPLLYLASILAGFALTLIEPVGFINAGIVAFFHVIGVLTIIVFSIALILLGLRALLSKFIKI
ncbi:hypothetical protein ACFFIS_14640 [Virgibacillus soli]|uniref:Uncharacterized protein n=1 Tax=Paracerasibacillus soli TaxID=480284 RepID=A0ABU5CV99_9BACI|nr:hypothetical protein [Virgibacillus soli]MDY0410304.1 hypothetical protein [Virgibacillus soli]